MRQLPADKYNVAWFKLAEFVSRGERERALSLYKLLIHSFDDYALACQLEGDIHLSFNDTQSACKSYRAAATMYKNSARFVEAAAVYEHILMLEPDVLHDLNEIIVLYEKLSFSNRLMVHIDRVCMVHIKNSELSQLDSYVQEWENKLASAQCALLYKNITLESIKKKLTHEYTASYLKKTINFLLLLDNPAELQMFLSTIEQLDKKYYQEATSLIQNL